MPWALFQNCKQLRLSRVVQPKENTFGGLIFIPTIRRLNARVVSSVSRAGVS